MRIMSLAIATVIISVAGSSSAQQPGQAPNLQTTEQKASYILGQGVGANFRQRGYPVDPQALLRGIMEGLQGKQPTMTPQEIQTAMQEFFKQVADKQEAELKAKIAAFAPENKEKSGVKTLPSGLQVRIVTQGVGRSPTEKQEVVCHYVGALTNGKVFDSSYLRGEPAKFGVGQVIKGWTEALQLMKEGGKWQLLIPPQLAYGDSPPRGSNIPANATLFFEVELLAVRDPQQQ